MADFKTTKVQGANGDIISSYTDTDGDKHLAVTTNQAKVVSPSNSSTVNLASGATFTGTSQNTLNSGSITVFLRADQDCIIYIDQSQDNTNWDITDQITHQEHTVSSSFSVETVGSFARVRIENISPTSSTTIFRLQTTFNPIGEALPRSLDLQGNLKTALYGLHDDFGFTGQFTPIRDLKVNTTHRLVGTVFGASNDTTFWTLSNTGTGSSATVATGFSTLTSGTANNGYGQIQSVRNARFIFANPNLCRGLVRATALGATNNTRRWGAFTTTATTVPNNGFYFSLNGSNVLSVNVVSGGSVTTVSSGSFNGDVNDYILDTNEHAYEIVYFMDGAWFYIDNALIHKFKPTTSPLCQAWDFPITATSINSALGTSSGTLEVWASSILRLGNEKTSPTSRYQSGTTAGITYKIGSGNLHEMVLSGIVNNSVVTIYDNTAASGTIIWSSGTMGAQTIPFSIDFKGLPFFTGLTISITGANSNVATIFE